MLKNTTQGTIVTAELREARTFTQKTVGLLKSENPAALFFRTQFGIHTFGMKFPIDIVICDSALRVHKIKKGLKPNRFFFWNPLWSYVFELPEGSIEKSSTTTGDILEMNLAPLS